MDESREALRLKENAVERLEDAIQNMPGGFDQDYIADLTGLESLRSAKGAQFKTASKEFLLGNLSRAGTRPNMWIEQQISDMAAKIGRSKEANETFTASVRADLAVERKRLEIADQLEEEYVNTLGYVPASISKQVDKLVQPYAEQKQKELAYDLRRIHEKELGPKSLNKLTEVPSGTPLTLEKARAIYEKAPGKTAEEKEENSMKIARKLGYTIPSEEIYARQQ